MFCACGVIMFCVRRFYEVSLSCSRIVLNCSRAFWRFSAICLAMVSGGGRFWVSSKVSSLSQKSSFGGLGVKFCLFLAGVPIPSTKMEIAVVLSWGFSDGKMMICCGDRGHHLPC